MSKMRFCEFCGKELENGGICDCQEAVQKSQKNNWMAIIKNVSKSKMLVIAVVLIIAVVAGVLLSSNMEKVELVQYIDETPDVSGLNGHASIDVTDLFDSSSFEYDLLESIEDKNLKDIDKMSDKELEQAFEINIEKFEECEQAVEDIVVTVWKNGDEVTELTALSNGDVIKIKAESDNPKNKILKMKYKPGTVEFIVENLEEGKAIDAFDEANVTVTYVGVNGDAAASLKYEASAIPDLSVYFTLKEYANDLSNGDKVEVLLDYDVELWESKGYFPLETSKLYTVEGLNSYLVSVDEIPAAQFEEMKATVVTAIHDDAKTWRDEISVENVTYAGNYYMTKKDGDDAMRTSNFLYLVYKVDVFENFAPEGGDDNHFSYYYYGQYGNLIVDQTGNIDYNAMSFNVPWKSFMRYVKMDNSILLGSVLVDYTGFETLEDLETYCIESNSEKYSYTTNIE